VVANENGDAALKRAARFVELVVAIVSLIIVIGGGIIIINTKLSNLEIYAEQNRTSLEKHEKAPMHQGTTDAMNFLTKQMTRMEVRQEMLIDGQKLLADRMSSMEKHMREVNPQPR
jgi:hypothetical protein